jgi:Domain of unknown function (DUF4345)
MVAGGCSRGDGDRDGEGVKMLAAALFYGYVLTLLVAGAWGMVGARLDQRYLFGLDLATMPTLVTTNLVSQYRFLRAVELGYGLFAWRYRAEILKPSPYSALFLTTMALGVLARLISLLLDGVPRGLFLFFLIYELVGVAAIWITVWRTPRSP